ncbi:hypothetical protein PG984_012896 [Apiospora sp. TS-2023a]
MQQDNLILFPSADESGERRNNVIFHLDAYLTRQPSEAQSPEEYAEELLSIASGESTGSLSDDTNPDGSRNPASPSIEKLIEILEILTCSDGSPSVEKLFKYVDNRVRNLASLADASITGSESSHGDKVKKDIKFAWCLFMERLYADEIINSLYSYAVYKVVERVFQKDFQDHRVGTLSIKTCASCIEREENEGRDFFVSKAHNYITCNLGGWDKEIWDSLVLGLNDDWEYNEHDAEEKLAVVKLTAALEAYAKRKEEERIEEEKRSEEEDRMLCEEK